MPAVPSGSRERRATLAFLAIGLAAAVVVLILAFSLPPPGAAEVPITVRDAFTTTFANVTPSPPSGNLAEFYMNSTAFVNQTRFESSTFGLATVAAVQYLPSPDDYYAFYLVMDLQGWIAPNLRPISINFTAGDLGPYNNSAALFFQTQDGSGVNVTVPQGAPNFGGDASSGTLLNLTGRSNDSTKWYSFSVANLRYEFDLGSYSGTHRLQLSLTLIGLSRVVSIQQDLYILSSA